MRKDERHNLDAREMKCFQSVCRVSRLERRGNEKVGRSVGVRKKM